MSEAYECDRCGSLHKGTPDTTLIVDVGYERTGEQDRPGNRFAGHAEMHDISKDLCESCRNDLRRWYAEPGGLDPSNPVVKLNNYREEEDSDGSA